MPSLTDFVILENAAEAICAGDTARTINLLGSYINEYPDSSSSLYAGYLMGQLYLQGRDTLKAVRSWKQALEVGGRQVPYGFTRKCEKVLEDQWYVKKADICVLISECYRKSNDQSTALDYLQLADTKYLPYRDCGNGMLMYRTMLSMYIAQNYLEQGDTTQAIQRLLEYFMSMERYSFQVTEMLHDILLSRYSQEEIKDQFKHAIKGMRIVRGGPNEPEKILEFTVLDHTIRKPAYRSLRDQKRLFREHRNIRSLMGT